MLTLRRSGVLLVATTLVALALTLSLAGHATARSSRVTSAATPVRCSAPGAQPITVVMVHGAWADPSSWNGEVEALQKDGCSVRAVDNPVQDLTSDARLVAHIAAGIKGPVLLVGHSYGGSVITNAAAEAHNVVGLVYVDAAAPAVGETTMQLMGKTSYLGTHPKSQLFTMVPGTTEMTLTENAFVHHFGQDLPHQEAVALWSEQTLAAEAAFTTPSRYAAWQTLPSWYFISSGDQIITPEEQLFMAHRAHSSVTIFHGGSHLTLISHPAAVTAVIGKALSSLLAQGK